MVMKRRTFTASAAGWIAGGAVASLGAPGSVRGAAVPRIAWISSARRDPGSPFFGALQQGLSELGLVESRDYRVELWWGNESSDGLDRLVAEMLRSNPDLIVTQGPIVFNVQQARVRQPVLFAYSGDPVEARLVDSLARPGGQLSGISMMSLELVGKRVEALAAAMPGLRKIAVVSNPSHAGERSELAVTQSAVSNAGLAMEYLPFRGDGGLEPTLAQALRTNCEALVVFADAGMVRRSELFAAFALQHRRPAASGWAEFARRGNLMSYGPNVRQVYRRLASFVDRVLKGTPPGALPVELPTVIEHVINLRAARAMSLEIPRAALLRADELLE
jgi:ABC-type uncharacterized transport system substrate-binding protein